MFDQEFKSESDINKAYIDHIESLIASRIEYDDAGIRHEWQVALENFRASKNSPPWLSH